MSNYRIQKLGLYTRMFAALSNPHRTAILMRLAKGYGSDSATCSRDEMRTCVGEVATHLTIAASTVSHHIKKLHQAGLIKVERHGRTVRCWVNTEAVRELADFLGDSVEPVPVPKRK